MSDVNFGELTNFSMKELYDVVLKATYKMKIGNKEFEPGEVVIEFDKIFISNFQELKSHVNAHGGYDDRPWVNWDETKEVAISFSQGVFSNTQFALLSNSHLIENVPSQTIPISKKEILESDDDGKIVIANAAIASSVYIYNSETGEKLDYVRINDTTFSISDAYKEVVVRYDYYYTNTSTIVKVGRNLYNGYLHLEGKTQLKDDNTGRVVTALLRIPKFKLMSDLSMSLGLQANPVVANFRGSAYPTGEGRNKSVLDLFILNDDLNADI